MKYHSDLTKNEILNLIVDSCLLAHELRENAICGDDEEITKKYDNRYQAIKELFNSGHIYILMEDE